MLTLLDTQATHTCRGYSRRDFLRIGTLAMGGLALPQLLAAKDRSSSPVAGAVKGKSVVLLFLQGGPPHIEFFDPKMTAPEGRPQPSPARCRRGCPASPSAAFPKLAAIADKFDRRSLLRLDQRRPLLPRVAEAARTR